MSRLFFRRRDDTSAKKASIRRFIFLWKVHSRNVEVDGEVMEAYRVKEITPKQLYRFFRQTTKDRTYTKHMETRELSLVSTHFRQRRRMSSFGSQCLPSEANVFLRKPWRFEAYLLPRNLDRKKFQRLLKCRGFQVGTQDLRKSLIKERQLSYAQQIPFPSAASNLYSS